MNLLEQFNTMKAMPIIEVNWFDYGLAVEDDFDVFTIEADEKGMMVRGIKIEWDDCLSLDEHLQTLFEKIIQRGLNY